MSRLGSTGRARQARRTVPPRRPPRSRWPGAANPHLLINKQTAMTTRAVSENWLTGPCRALTATLERLRVDRQPEEALACDVGLCTSPPCSGSITPSPPST
jgi:hypothetical protein